MSVLIDLGSYHKLGEIFFSKKDMKKIHNMTGEIIVLSTVCPHYPDNGKEYTFYGELGSGISLTTKQHIKYVPALNNALLNIGLKPLWLILVADLPETVEPQREFYERVAGTREEYLKRCQQSARAVCDVVRDSANVETFSSFYAKKQIPYLKIQEKVASNVLAMINADRGFSARFTFFMIERQELSEKFRGRRLSLEEHKIAAAHAMSLYITHGTLLRSLFPKGNLIVINHSTLNLKNFFLCELVDDYKHLNNFPKFPVGIINEELY